MKCLKCNRENRDEAKYCRFCGEEIEQSVQNVQNGQSSHGAQAAAQNGQSSQRVQSAPVAPAATNPVDGFIGHEKIRELLNKFIILRRQEKMDEEAGGTSDSKNTIFLFSGNPGTGKKTVAEWFANQLKAEKLVAGRIETMDAQQLKKHGKDEYELYDYIAQNNFGVLIIREVHRETEYLNEIINAFYKSKNGCVCICIGLKNKLDDFLKKNPDSKQRIKPVDFDNYTDDTLYEILEYKLTQMGLKHDASVCDILKDFVVEENNKENKEYENGWLIENAVIQKIKEARAERISNGENTSPEIIKDDIPLKNRRRTEEEILAELDSLIGLTEVKKTMRTILATVKANKERPDTGKKATPPIYNFCFTGNPGTGKTTVARMLGELLNSIGLLPSSKVVECKRDDLIAGYEGQTEGKVKECFEKAKGGVLFIDEVYSLVGDNYGQKAIETMLPLLLEDNDKRVVVVAGYKDDVMKFMNANPGLPRRFPKDFWIHLPDYNEKELIQIYKLCAKKEGYIINAEAEKVLEKVIKQMYAARDKNFGNAGDVRSLFESTIRKHNSRLVSLPESERTPENWLEIKAEDIQLEEKENKEQTKEEILKELDSMIGLEGVKKEVRTLMDAIKIENEIAEKTGDIAKKPLRHYLLTGNPGTGKTTVARILGKLFKAIGLLPTDTFIHASRAELVATTVGGTAPLVNEVCDRAMGGILFIDEAYSLVQGDSDQYGHEAVDALIQRMENDRGKFVVIAAGYKKNMETFLQANPGLPDRFYKPYIHLEDYNETQLYELFELYAKNEHYILEDGAVDTLKDCISYIYENRGPDFGNGRTIRNFYDKVKDKQRSRIAKLSIEERSKILLRLSAEDVTAAFEEFKEAGI